MNRTLNIFLLLISTLSYSQNNSEFDIFKKIIDYEIGQGSSYIYLRCEKTKTFFDQNSLKEQTGLKVPKTILEEIKKNALKSNAGIWNPDLIKELNYGSDFINNEKCLTLKDAEKCLTLKDAEKLFNKSGKKLSVILLSQPIFDSKFEHCVISISYLTFTGSAYGHTYFLKKVYGIWTIIVEYEPWMS